MVSERSLILDSAQVKQKIRRMAYEIYEHNFNEKVIVIAGIDGQGYMLAKLLIKEVESISPIKTILVKLTLDKSAPQQSTWRASRRGSASCSTPTMPMNLTRCLAG